MVGIGTGLKIAGVGISGLILYTLLKNSGQIGSKVGGFFGDSVASLGSGITQGFSDAFSIFGGQANAGVNGKDDVNTTADKQVQAGEPVTVDPNAIGFHPISKPFAGFVESGAITEGFAEKFSFQPPANSNQLDVSNTFGYISRPSYIQRLNQDPEQVRNNFGGYGSAENQRDALARAIEQSARDNPEYFA